jgi:hypothetical protein
MICDGGKLKYRHAPVFADSLSTVHHAQNKFGKLKK